MPHTQPADQVQRSLASIVGVHLEVTHRHDSTRPAQPSGAHIRVVRGPWYGDPWSGSTAESTVTLSGLWHPSTGRALTLELRYVEHDLSGQTDSWTLTLAGFPAPQASALRDALSPFRIGSNLNRNLEYRWTIDGRAGRSRTT